MNIKRGTSQYFPVLISNDGLVPARYTIKATGSAPGYTLRYTDYSNNANVTAQIVAGTFLTDELAPGASFAMKVSVTVSKTGPAVGGFAVTASALVGGHRDVVKGIVNAT